MINLKRRNYNDNICEYMRHLKVIKCDMVGNSSGRLFRYFGAACNSFLAILRVSCVYVECLHNRYFLFK